MATAKQWSVAANRPETYASALGKLLVVGIILAPLVMMLLPELNHRSGSMSRGPRHAPAARAPVSDPVLIPEHFSR
jgi:hypothetical protein